MAVIAPKMTNLENTLFIDNFLVFAVAIIFIIYIIYLFLKRAVEKNDGDNTLEAEETNKWTNLRKFTFTLLYSAMTACVIYLMDNDKTGAITYFVIFFIAGLLIPERKRELKSSKSKAGKILRYIILLVFLLLFVILTVTSTASIFSKVGAWLILFIIYLLEKIEKKHL